MATFVLAVLSNGICEPAAPAIGRVFTLTTGAEMVNWALQRGLARARATRKMVGRSMLRVRRDEFPDIQKSRRKPELAKDGGLDAAVKERTQTKVCAAIGPAT